jgi:hypothetical protein
MSNHNYPPQSEQVCGNCRYYMNYECHRHAPAPILGQMGEAKWPGTDEEGDWCGEWAPQEVTR